MFGGIPFEHFAHGGGGMGGMPGSMNGDSAEPPDTEKLYETLEVDKSATQKEIKKAYYRLSKEHHPDKGKFFAFGSVLCLHVMRRKPGLFSRSSVVGGLPAPTRVFLLGLHDKTAGLVR